MLEGKKIVVTAGPTHELIDPVRFIGNYSTGKMGYAIVDELVKEGAEVTLVSGPTNLTPNDKAKSVAVQSANQMYEAVFDVAREQDIFVFTAAVADYTPQQVSDTKLKKKDDQLFIELKKTKDIAAEIGKFKNNKQISVGFALETNDEEQNALKKLASKNLDFVVLNSMRNKGTCFGSDHNKISIFSEEDSLHFEAKPKVDVAKDIVAYLKKKVL